MNLDLFAPSSDPCLAAEDSNFSAGSSIAAEPDSNRKSKIAGKKCLVCSDDATGFHYKVATCEGCKGFFRRAVQKKANFVCVNGGDCVIYLGSRTKCQKCRFDKCLSVGMAPQMVMSDKERANRRQTKHESPNSQELPTSTTRFEDSDDSEEDGPAAAFTETEIELTNSIQNAYQRVFTRHKHSTKCASEAERAGSKLADLLTPSVTRVIEFTQMLPGFNTLNPDDRVNLLQGCSLEILYLRAASRYDRNLGFPLRHDCYLHRSSLTDPTFRASILPLFDWAECLGPLDEMEAALVAATLVYQMFRSGLLEPKRVEEQLDNIITITNKYCRINSPSKRDRFEDIIATFSALKTLGMRQSSTVLCVEMENTLPLILLHLLEEDI